MGFSVPTDDPQEVQGHGAWHALMITGSVCLVTGVALLLCGLGMYAFGYRRKRLDAAGDDDVIDGLGDVNPCSDRSRMIPKDGNRRGYTQVEQDVHHAPSHVM